MNLRESYESEEVAANYRTAQDEGSKLSGYRLREERIVRRMIERAGVIERALDVPCGTGRYLGMLAKGGIIVGADGSRAMLLEVPEGDALLFQADAFRLPFKDDAFDLVLCMRFLHHLGGEDDLRRCIAELARVCRGTLICSFFESFSLQHFRRVVKEKLSGKKSKRYAMSVKKFSGLLAGAGFEIVDLRRPSRFISETCVGRAIKSKF
ncbi:MAG: methyltransferase domain-containing protein [Planctomycetes bacterium]|nr:methyltransferase domain-containing protein [Planctomycetota bacterium]